MRQTVQAYKENIFPPPVQIRDGWTPTPEPRAKENIMPVAAPRA